MKRPSWNQYFMDIAKVVSTRSGDPNTQVGCVIVDGDRRILSTGYNHTPSGFDKSKEDWSRPAKYKMVVHAEINALLFARQSLKNCSLYTTLQPCSECIKAIAGSGIKTVYYLESRLDRDMLEFSKHCKIELKKI